MPTGVGLALCVPVSSWLGHLSNRVPSRPWLGKPAEITAAIVLSSLLSVRVSQGSMGSSRCPQGHLSPTQPAAGPAHRTVHPDLTVINHSPSHALRSQGAFPQAWLQP